jgi:hypothetical protein
MICKNGNGNWLRSEITGFCQEFENQRFVDNSRWHSFKKERRSLTQNMAQRKKSKSRKDNEIRMISFVHGKKSPLKKVEGIWFCFI